MFSLFQIVGKGFIKAVDSLLDSDSVGQMIGIPWFLQQKGIELLHSLLVDWKTLNYF